MNEVPFICLLFKKNHLCIEKLSCVVPPFSFHFHLSFHMYKSRWEWTKSPSDFFLPLLFSSHSLSNIFFHIHSSSALLEQYKPVLLWYLFYSTFNSTLFLSSQMWSFISFLCVIIIQPFSFISLNTRPKNDYKVFILFHFFLLLLKNHFWYVKTFFFSAFSILPLTLYTCIHLCIVKWKKGNSKICLMCEICFYTFTHCNIDIITITKKYIYLYNNGNNNDNNKHKITKKQT